MKLASTLVEIKHLKMEIHLFHSEVASMEKWVETSDAHQKLVAKALDRANKENATLMQ